MFELFPFNWSSSICWIHGVEASLLENAFKNKINFLWWFCRSDTWLTLRTMLGVHIDTHIFQNVTIDNSYWDVIYHYSSRIWSQNMLLFWSLVKSWLTKIHLRVWRLRKRINMVYILGRRNNNDLSIFERCHLGINVVHHLGKEIICIHKEKVALWISISKISTANILVVLTNKGPWEH